MAIVSKDGVDGKICNKCGEWKPVSRYSHQRRNLLKGGDGYLYTCKECHNAAERAKYAANSESEHKKAKAYYEAHREAIIASSQRYRERNPERRKQTDREYYLKNRERRKAEQQVRNRLRRAADPEGINAYQKMRARVRQEANPEKVRLQQREIDQRRRNRENNAEGFHTVAEWEALKVYYDHTCLRCRRREPEIMLTRDHVVPLSKGGSDWIDNIQPLCFSCNSSKGDTYVDYRPTWEAERSGRYPERPNEGGTPLRERRAPYFVRPYLARLFRGSARSRQDI